MAATAARGTTRIQNAACEPEMTALAGVLISGAIAAMMSTADSQLLVRAADGSPLRLPEGTATARGLRIQVSDAGAGVERFELRAEDAGNGQLALAAVATDALGHQREVSWQTTGAY